MVIFFIAYYHLNTIMSSIDIICCENGIEPSKKISNFRRFLPQVIASTAKNMLLLSGGLVVAFPAILLTGLYDNPNEQLNLNNSQASWLASLALLSQPLGSLISGAFTEPLGRKKAMLLSNLPFLFSWITIYFANSIYLLYIAATILGLGVGFIESPTLTYIGEICEPKYRGALIAYSELWFQIAAMVMNGLGSLLHWRHVAASCAVVPIITALGISLIPESPLWLISRGKLQAAEDALCWLRGWTVPENVKDELTYLVEYKKNEVKKKQVSLKPTTSADTPNSEDIKMSVLKNIYYFFRAEVRRPLLLTISMFFFSTTSGFSILKPYYVHVRRELNIDMDTYQLLVWISVVQLIAGVLNCFIIKYTGKRILSLCSFGGSAICSFGLTFAASSRISSSWALYLSLMYSFCTSLIISIPWMLQSEVYPLAEKSVAAGIASASSYIFVFIGTKMFFTLEDFLEISGVLILFTFFSIFGLVYVWFRLPETEGKTFDEIHLEFVK